MPAPSPLAPIPAAADLTRSPLDILREMASRQPDACALADARGRLTFADLLSLCEGVAHRLDRDVPPGGTVGAVVGQSALGVAALLGCIASGRLCLAINASDPPERRAALLTQARADAVVTEADAQAARLDPPEVIKAAPHDPDGPAVVHFTSGSSGQPKGIVLSARSALYRAHTVRASSGLSPSDRFVMTSTPTTASGVSFLLASLSAGAIGIVASAQRDGVRGVLALARAWDATALVANARILRVLCDQPSAPAAFARLRYIRAGGVGMTAGELALVRRTVPPDCVLNHAYASTEAVVVAEWNIPASFGSDAPPDASAMPVGYIRPELEFRLVDDEGRAATADAPGMMLVRSPYVALGEWRDGTLVAGRIHPDPSRRGWRTFATGDLLRLGQDGLAYFAGRADRQVNRNGARVEPGEVEAVLRGVPGVTDAVVFGIGAGDAVALHAVVAAPAASGTAVKQALQAVLRQKLPASHRPTGIMVLDALPALPGGKVDVAALRLRAANTPALGRGDDA